MVGWKRRIATWAAARAGLRVAPIGRAWSLIEPEQLKRFLEFFDVDCVFDVGANVGQYAQRLRWTGFKGLIISFEPIPEAVRALRHSSRRDANWIVKEIALDSQSRAAEFNIMYHNQFSSFLLPDHSGAQRFLHENRIVDRLVVETRTLAELFPALQTEFGFHRPFLKMDTQGYDAQVVAGAGEDIRKFVGLQSELTVNPLYIGAQLYYQTLNYYQSLGFKISGFVPNHAGHFPDLNDIDCILYNPDFLDSAATTSPD